MCHPFLAMMTLQLLFYFDFCSEPVRGGGCGSILRQNFFFNWQKTVLLLVLDFVSFLAWLKYKGCSNNYLKINSEVDFYWIKKVPHKQKTLILFGAVQFQL